MFLVFSAAAHISTFSVPREKLISDLPEHPPSLIFKDPMTRSLEKRRLQWIRAGALSLLYRSDLAFPKLLAIGTAEESFQFTIYA